MNPTLRCCICLRPDSPKNPVVKRPNHVGGIGDVEQAECADRVACWAYIDRRRKLVSTR